MCFVTPGDQAAQESAVKAEGIKLISDEKSHDSLNEGAIACKYGTIENEMDDSEGCDTLDVESEGHEIHSTASGVDDKRETSFFAAVVGDCRNLQLLLIFELLMASVILALLLQSTPIIQWLWPASKAIVLASFSHWYLAIGLSSAVAAVLLIGACL